MQPYRELIADVMLNGDHRPTRAILKSTGEQVRAKSAFGRQIRFDLGAGFPAVTGKQLAFRWAVIELLWLLRGEQTTDYLKEHNVDLWDEWSREGGDVGPIYGWQWRRWGNPNRGLGAELRSPYGVDQIARVVRTLRTDPYDRRMIVSAWNVEDIPDMALPPCPVMFQFYVTGDRRLSCHMYQRSADLFLGVPFDIAQYALLTHMVAQVTDLGVGELVISYGDVHVYDNHRPAVELYLARAPFSAPKLWLEPRVRDIDDFRPDHIKLIGYEHHPAIRAEVGV